MCFDFGIWPKPAKGELEWLNQFFSKSCISFPFSGLYITYIVQFVNHGKWNFWGDKEFSDIYENIYIRSFIEDWFGIVAEMVREIDSVGSSKKLVLDVGCGEGHTTKQILDRISGDYVCDLLEPDANALTSAEAYLTPENNIGERFPRSLATFKSEKKYDVIFTSHTNYYWALNQKDYDQQLTKISSLLADTGKLLILTLPEESGHYRF